MRLLSFIWQNLVRNRKNFMFSSVGLIVGISTFVFFVALGTGVKEVVLEQIFQIRQIEVIPRSFDLSITKASGARLDARAIERLRQIPGVVAAFPKMKFTFPAWASGGKELLGKSMRTEVIADGIPPEIVRDDFPNGYRFRDWDAEFTCVGEGTGDGVGCPEGRRCIDSRCTKIACNATLPARYSPCKGDTYCAADLGSCEMPMPAIVNPALLAIYNSSLTTAVSSSQEVKLPKLSQDALIGLTFNVELGRSYLGQSALAKPIDRKVQIIGFSDKAITLGFTVPISYVKRLNGLFSGLSLRDDFHSVVVEAQSNERVASITKAIAELGFDLDAKHVQAERMGFVITIVTLIFTLTSLLIIIVSAINIAHTFFMIIAERRREIGILRAIGASRGHIRVLILGEAVLLGLLGGAAGVFVGRMAALAVDALSSRFLPDFPYKPESFFVFEASVQAWAVVAAVGFCLLGAFIPARRAAHMEPAIAFSTQ
jgi:putative ABC transport system permease protein